MGILDTSGISDEMLYDLMVYAMAGVLVLVGIVLALKARQWRAERKGRRRRNRRRL
jgi:hypothetical protein